MMRERQCPLCRNSDRAVLYAEANFDPARLNAFSYASRKIPEYMHHRLLNCRTCDIVFASPVPEVSELASGYLDAAYDSQAEAACAAQTYLRALRPIFHRLPDRQGTLDIGTGDGAILHELLQAGFQNVVGIEPSAAPVAAAAPQIRPLIIRGLFEPGLLPPGSFTLITCFQTIEHVDDPLTLCQEAHRLLKPGGALCLVGHNRRALSARLLGRRSPIFDIEHLQLFSPHSMRRLLELSDFHAASVTPLFNRYPIAYWTRLFPFPGFVKRRLLSLLNAGRLGRIPVSLPAGNLLAVGFK